MKLLDDSFISFVNLDHRTDRLARMQESLRQVGIEATRTRGFYPHEVKVDPKRVAIMQNRTPGAIGCHFSQVMIMEQALALGRHAFVMEDDLVFCSDFRRRISLIQAFLRDNPWDIVWLGGTFHVNPSYWHNCGAGRPPRDAELTTYNRMIRTYGAFCTYAYIVRNTSVAKVLQLLDRELDSSIGIDYAMIRIQPELHTYAFVPGCIKQADGYSDIGKPSHLNKPAFTKFSGFSKLGPYWWQNEMSEFDPETFNWAEAKIK